ncbi:MAG TPA: chromosomal replication initiator protein DnaA [Thiobacillaceae bacterium]|nr:chromosomal replication initiator protein DnaA [Thiobacillaceae bacterium]HNF90088.1 chromosomal replication initiator protein DnaA [Thiobacillaceae bacterium]HNH89073.1 chromosomal replication initiator protein DnaA [Thiobacillaceae bacterium]HNI07529.1 chromosomal replication initiator protein DnaA [Thiobacillaceae bacterium]
MDDFWSHCLAHFERSLNAQQLNTWIKPLVVEVVNGSVLVNAPNRFVAQWVRDKFLPQIDLLARAFFPESPSVSLVISDSRGTAENRTASKDSSAPQSAGKLQPSTPPAREEARKPGKSGAKAEKPQTVDESRLNPMFTFDTFVPGKANDLARAAALQVADNPGSGYNPLFVYGGVGLGKTHLVQAIGNRMAHQNPKARVRYIHADRYVSDMVRAVRANSYDDFKRRYDSLDLLLIDDIQFFAGKEGTQEQFFYTFNTLIEEHKQVIITSDTFPKDMEGIEERLKSRFSWGLTVMLEPPELEMRVAILLDKARLEKADLDEGTAFFIAKQVRSNVRELEGALKRVIAFARFNKHPISVELAKEALKDLLAVQNRQISIENIQKTVADYFKIKVADMYSKKRTRILARPRQMAMYLARELTDLSYPEIGQSFGGRDHTTVLHACSKIEELKNSDATLRKDYNLLIQVLTG